MHVSLTDALLQRLHGAPMQRLAQALALPTGQVAAAAEAAVPLLFGTLAHHVRQPGAAGALLDRLRDLPAGQDPGSTLGEASGDDASTEALLADVFGERLYAAARAIAAASGPGEARALDLLRAFTAPVLAYLAMRLLRPAQTVYGDAPHPGPEGLVELLAAEERQLRSHDSIGARALAVAERDWGGIDVEDFIGSAPLSVQTAEMRSPRAQL